MPPPNLYSPKDKYTSTGSPATGFGYGERYNLSKSMITPGPGNYDTPKKIGEGPKYVIG